MTETQMHRKIRIVMCDYSIRFAKIETGGTEIGIPDIYYYASKPVTFDGWMEYKHVPTFDTKRVKIPWRPGQLARGQGLVESCVTLWLCMASDDTEDFVFIPGYMWAQQHAIQTLKNNEHSVYIHDEEMTMERIVNVLKRNQYS